MPKNSTLPTAEQFGEALDDLADALRECLAMARELDEHGGTDAQHEQVARFERVVGGLRHDQ